MSVTSLSSGMFILMAPDVGSMVNGKLRKDGTKSNMEYRTSPLTPKTNVNTQLFKWTNHSDDKGATHKLCQNNNMKARAQVAFSLTANLLQ